MFIEKHVLLTSQEAAFIIKVEHLHYNPFYLPVLLSRKTVMVILISGSQQVDKLPCLEIVADEIPGGLLFQEAAHVRHHFLCIDLILQHLVSGIQLVKVLGHGKDMLVRLRIGAEVHGKRAAGIVNHHFEFRIGTYVLPRILQPVIQKAVDARAVFRDIPQERFEGRGGKPWGGLFHREAVRPAPGHLLTGLADRAETPVPDSRLQYLMRVEHAPGYGLGQDIVVSLELLVLREVELQVVRLLHMQRHQ